MSAPARPDVARVVWGAWRCCRNGRIGARKVAVLLSYSTNRTKSCYRRTVVERELLYFKIKAELLVMVRDERREQGKK